jgi:hypothetical protein
MEAVQLYKNNKFQWLIGVGVAAPLLVTLLLYRKNKSIQTKDSKKEFTQSYYQKLTFIEKENQESISTLSMTQMIEFLNHHKYKVSEVIRYAITMCQHSHLRYCTLSKAYFVCDPQKIRRKNDIIIINHDFK